MMLAVDIDISKQCVRF